MNDNPEFEARWEALIASSRDCVFNDLIECENLDHALKCGAKITGCYSPWWEKSDEEWRARIYLGKSQRVIGLGTVYQVAYLYDLARVYFRKYRSKKSIHASFNLFPNDTAANGWLQTQKLLDGDPRIRAYFSRMEKILIDYNLISDRSDRKRLVAVPRPALIERIQALELRIFELERRTCAPQEDVQPSSSVINNQPNEKSNERSTAETTTGPTKRNHSSREFPCAS